MDASTLPKAIKGQWIWLDDGRDLPESYRFFRREFPLDEIPSSAELWIACRSFFHLFVNGHHLSYALGTYPAKGSYVWNFDLTYLLATGVNTIAILAHNTQVARTSCRLQPDGLWCQFDVDDHPLIWSDHSWHVLVGECFAGNRPRRSTSSGFSERVDLGLYPHGWQKSNFGAAGWLHPNVCQPYAPSQWKLHPFPAPEFTSEILPLSAFHSRGTWHPASATTHVSFSNLFAKKGCGMYAAETYLYSTKAESVPFELYADNPYRFFVNGAAVKEQGLRPLAIGESFLSCKALCFRQGETVDPMGALPLQEGWNRLNLFLDVEPGTCGATLAFPGLSPSELRVRRVPDESALPGWVVAGPLKTPMVNILGNLALTGEMEKEYFVALPEMPLDEAVELTMLDYRPTTVGDEPVADGKTLYEEGVILKQGEYAIVGLERSHFGCPAFSLCGTAGDVVDLVAGTEVVEGQLVPIDGVRQHVDTVILADAETRWMSCFPKAVRHVMIVARVVKDAIVCRRGEIHRRHYAFDNGGGFESSDAVVNRLWQVGRNTLDATVQEVFIDSPAKDQTQYVPDAFIESWSTYFVYGNYSLVAKALHEFAESQFETGEFPAASPSGVYLNIPDFALLWPVWLRNHYMYTGDRKVLDQLLPAAERLFEYFAEISDPDTGLLNDLGRRYKAYCFLDHAPIDRRGVITGLNAIYSRSLLTGAWLFETVNREEVAEILRQRLNLLVDSIAQLTWNEERGLFADAWVNGERSGKYSMQTNVLALYGGLATPEQYDGIFDALFTAEPPYEKASSGDADNPFFKYFILETAFALGRREWAFDYMKWYWGGMLEKGANTWWELFNPRTPDAIGTPGSTCHGYGVSPNAFLVREVAGIRPAIPGYSAIYFNPLVSRVKSVDTKIPTRYGHIALKWEIDDQGRLDASINSTYPLAVIPELDPAVAELATIRVGEEVSIFAEPAG